MAGAWRVEPEAVTSDVTNRLLGWMTRASGSLPEVEVVAGQIEMGLREIVDAQCALVLARRLPNSDLTLEATTLGAFPNADERSGESFAARGLLSVLPGEPFWIEDAEAPMQVLLGELWDWARANVGTPSVPDVPPELLLAPVLCAPLRAEGPWGESEIAGLALLWIATPDGMISRSLRPVLEAASVQAGGWLSSALREERLASSYRDLAAVFASAIDGRDVNRAGHSDAVAYYARSISQALSLPEREVAQIEFAALLHDIGRSGLPDELLQKSVPLSDEERQNIRSALVAGAEGLREVEGLDDVSAMVRHQGERFDGQGYPDGLSGEAIPLGARILAVAQRFCALTKPRADRRAMAVVSGALDHIARESGSAFDPAVVHAFMAVMGRTVNEELKIKS